MNKITLDYLLYELTDSIKKRDNHEKMHTGGQTSRTYYKVSCDY